MKKFLTLLFVTLTIIARGQVLLDDDLSAYTNNAKIDGQAPWTSSSSTIGGGGNCSSNLPSACSFVISPATALSYAGYSAGSGRAIGINGFSGGDNPGRNYATPNTFDGTANKVYYFAFLLNVVTANATTATTGAPLLSLHAGSTFASNRVASLYIGNRIGSGASATYKLSASKNNSTLATSTASYNVGTTYLVVVKYTFVSGISNDIMDVFVNPTTASEPGTPTLTQTSITDGAVTATGMSLNRFILWSNGGSSSAANLTSFKAGETWADLFPACNPPTATVASAITNTTATVAWTAPSVGYVAANYDYEYATNSAFTGATAGNTGGTGTSINLTGLTPNTPYYVRIRTNTTTPVSCTSSWSPTYSFSTLPDCVVPTGLAASSITATNASLAWTQPVGSVGPLGTWDIEYATNAAFTGSTIVTPMVSPYVLTGLTPSTVVSATNTITNTTYYARIRNKCSGGDGPWSTAINFNTLARCVMPTTVTTSSITGSSGTIAWVQPTGSETAPTTWDIELSSGSITNIATTTGITNPYSATGLNSSTTYYVNLRSNCGASGNSIWSFTNVGGSLTTLVTCTTPTTVTTSNLTSSSVDVNFTQPGGSASAPTSWEYELAPGGNFTGTATGTTFSMPFTINSGLTPGGSYQIKVRAVCSGPTDKSGWSIASSSFSVPCPASFDISTSGYAEGFNGAFVSGSSNCWTSATLNLSAATNNGFATITSAANPTNSALVPSEGSRFLRYDSWNISTNGKSRLISPTFATTGMTGVELSFDMVEENANVTAPKTLDLVYSIDNGTTWLPLLSYSRRNTALASGTTSMRWVRRYYTLPAAVNNISTLKVGMEFTSEFNTNFFVDNFKIGGFSTIQNVNDNVCTTVTSATTVSGANWFRILSGTNTVLEINPNGSNLGTVTVKYQDYAAGAANVLAVSGQKYLPRYLAITPATAPTTSVMVRQYFMDAELADYNTAAGFSKTISQLGISKKSVTAGTEDCDPFNNTTGAASTALATTAVDYGTGFYLEYSTSAFSEFAAVESGIALAAELTTFTATKSANNNRLAWTTATEKNVAYFNIERSTNGQNNWASIGTVKATGNSSAEQKYTFNDATPTDIAYYRLVTKDNDGKESTSKTVSVVRAVKHLSIQKVSPNPFYTEGSSVDVLVGKSSKLTVIVTDVLGKIVKTETFSVQEGATTLPLNLNNLAQGTYILTINDGETIATQRIVKQ
jgi:hypothetical protein